MTSLIEQRSVRAPTRRSSPDTSPSVRRRRAAAGKAPSFPLRRGNPILLCLYPGLTSRTSIAASAINVHIPTKGVYTRRIRHEARGMTSRVVH